MPRSERKKSKTGIYHIVLRGINKQLIFEESEDYSKFIEILAEVKGLSGFKLYAFCLMGNHIHLLIKEGEEPLAQVFKRIGARYVFWFNWKYGRNGHLFQDRFLSEPIESDEYLTTVLIYLFQNPVKAGLCKHPKGYEWCSRKYLGKSSMIDEAELFEIVPVDLIKELERREIECGSLEPKIGRRMAVSEADAIVQMKAISGAGSVTGFQGLGREAQMLCAVALREKGVSVRQFARISGLGKGVVERMYRIGQDA